MLSAIIPAAGKGTRMNLITNGGPKELLPVNGKPLIVYTIQEAIDAGARAVFIIISREKHQIAEHLETRAVFIVNNRHLGFRDLPDTGTRCIFLEQKEPLGVAHALSLAEPDINTSDFFVLMPDNYYPDRPFPSVQLVDNYNRSHCCIGIMELSSHEAETSYGFGLVTIEPTESRTVKIVAHSGKQKRKFEPESQKGLLQSVGRALYSHDFFDTYRELSYASKSEKDDIPVLQKLIQDGKLEGFIVRGRRFDAGSPSGYKMACDLE